MKILNSGITFLLIFMMNFILSAQGEQTRDTTLNFDDLNPDEFTYTPDFELKASYGWFPVPVDNYFNIALEYMSGDISDLASEINPGSFVKTKFPYSGNNPLSDDEREIKQSYKNIEVDDEEYPETDFLSIGFHALFNTKFPLILRLHTVLSFSEGMLFSLDETKSYLTYLGSKSQFKEASIIYHDEIMFNAGINFLIPFYGAFANIEVPVETYYYLSFGLTWSTSLSSRTTQYSQIANAKDNIRYYNGQDTVHLLTEKTLKNLNYSRYFANIGLGFEFDIARIGFGMEFYVSSPLNSVIKDALWKQWIYGMKLNINFLGFF
ncbi:MAG: hypothetical protein HZB41_08810 [Ignavibacteriae bacterium]|nr:hypothetical protein [Ignavibacteriota bacterium]